MPLQRNSPDSARQIVEELIPDPGHRSACLQLLAAAVRAADQHGADKWGVTLHPSLVRVNVGRIEVMTVSSNSVHLVFHDARAPQGLAKVRGLGWSAPTTYRSVPGSFSCSVPARHIPTVAKFAAAPHQFLIERAAATPRHTMTVGAHSPGVLQYVEQELGIALPAPAYARKPRPASDRAEGTTVTGDRSGETYTRADIAAAGTFAEGAETQVAGTTRERSARLRERARHHFASRSPDGRLHCAACTWAAPAALDLSSPIVEIHHEVAISGYPAEGKALSFEAAVKLLTPLCPNCHRVLHGKRGGGCHTLADLRRAQA